MAVFRGKGRVKHSEVIQSVTVTPEDVGVLSPGDTVRAVLAVVTNLGTRDPKTVSNLSSDSALVSLAFEPPRTLAVTVGPSNVPVDQAFTFEGDAT